MSAIRILPGTGRGTATPQAAGWSGTPPQARPPDDLPDPTCPSTILRMVPLPVPGRIG